MSHPESTSVTEVPVALHDRLAHVLGEPCVIDSEPERTLCSTDVYGAGAVPALVLRPENANAVPEAVRLCAEAGYAMTVRGGGMSYTGGYVPASERSVVFDLSRLNRILEINPDDLVVTVEAGVTWSQLYDALSPLGLRLPFFGTFSGARATVGGGLSNGALFMGTARHGTAAEIVVALDVVAADGRLIRTGQPAFHNGRPAFRNYGPDLTGLFVHDAGSLGVKLRASLRLMEAPAAERPLSFACASESDAMAALSAIGRGGFAEEVYVFDPATTARSLAPAALEQDVKRLVAVMKRAGKPLEGLMAGFRVARAGRSFAPEGMYTLHAVCAGRSEAAVAADVEMLRERATSLGCLEIEPSIPTAARANPFEPVNGILGHDGERWAALNAKVPHSDAPRLVKATQAAIEPHAEAMARHGVTMSFLYIAIGNHVFSYEPVLRWKDEWLPVHRKTPEPDHLARLQEPPANPRARRVVHQVRQAIVDAFADFGAASNQIGKTYPHLPSLNPESRQLLLALKRELDPSGLMNPGALAGAGAGAGAGA